MLYHVLNRQLDRLRMNPGAGPPHHFPLDRVGLAADPDREVPSPPVV
jgi:hypothetical protein